MIPRALTAKGKTKLNERKQEQRSLMTQVIVIDG